MLFGQYVDENTARRLLSELNELREASRDRGSSVTGGSGSVVSSEVDSPAWLTSLASVTVVQVDNVRNL